jgi:hypothetical protein
MTEYFDGFDTKDLGRAITKVRASTKPVTTTAALARAAGVDESVMKQFELEGTGLDVGQAEKTLPLLRITSFSDLMSKAEKLWDTTPSAVAEWGQEIEHAHASRMAQPLARQEEATVAATDAPPPAETIKYAGKRPSRLMRILDGGLIKQADFPDGAPEILKQDKPRGRE